jgi:TetR/AcrR family transcriptional regulator
MARCDSEQRKTILEASIRVFSESGLNGAVVRQVAEAAGVNSALLYYYFENKEILFQETVKLVISGLLDQFQATRKEFASGCERISFLVDGLWDYYTRHPERMRLMAVANIMHPETIAKILPGLARERVLMPLEILEEGIRRGELKRMHPLQLWWSILGTCFFRLFMKKVMMQMDYELKASGMPVFDDDRQQIKSLVMEGVVATRWEPDSPGRLAAPVDAGPATPGQILDLK